MSEVQTTEEVTQEATPEVVQEAPQADVAVESTEVLAGTESVVEEIAAGSDEDAVNQFLESLSPEAKEVAAKKGFKTVEDSIKGYSELEGLMGKKLADLKPEELELVNTKLGVPADANDYEFQLPEGIEDDGSLQEFREFSKETGLPKDKAEKVFGWFRDKQVAQLEASGATHEETIAKNTAALAKEYGDAFDEKAALAKNTLLDLGGEELQQSIVNAGLSSDPALVKLFVSLGEKMQEGSVKGNGAKHTFTKTPAEIEHEIADFRVKNHDALYQARHENHNWAVEELNKLYKLKK